MASIDKRVLAGGAASLLALAACGTNNNSTSSSGSGGCQGTITVASDLPTSGGDAAIGGGTEEGVHLAVTQAINSKMFGGCTLKYIAKNDASAALGKHDPALGKQNITQLANDPSVVGVVGPFNSSVAVAELPVSNQADLAQISPSNTDPGLTIAGSDPDINTAQLKPTGKTTYFRVISNDKVQAQVIATVAYKEKNLRKIYDIDDQETYGKDLSNYFDSDFQALGGTIVKRVGLPGDTKDFHSVLTEAKGLGADGVFFGGVASNGSGLIKAQMADVGLTSSLFLSGDGTVDPQYFKDAGSAGDGGIATSAPDTLSLSSAQSFVTAFKSAYNTDPVAYSTYGYDAMNILLQAIKNVISNNGGTIPTNSGDFRAKVVAAVAQTDYHGTIGETKFDSNGDTQNSSFSVYQAANGKWSAYETCDAQGNCTKLSS